MASPLRIASILFLCGLAACNSAGPAPISTGLGKAPPDWGTPIDTQSVLDRMKEPGAISPRVFGINEPYQPPPPIKPITDKSGPTTLPGSDGSTVTVTVDPVKPDEGVKTITPEKAAPEKPLAQKIDDTVMSLIDLLVRQSMAGQMEWRNYLTLAALDNLHPGAMPRVITPDQKGGGPLNADDRQAVESLREFFAGIASIPTEMGPDARADRMAELADKLLESRPMRIRSPALCSRVAGYGQFTPLPTNRFVVGRPIRAIVYAELSRFGHRPIGDSAGAAPGDRWTVELSQTLELYHDADGTKAWSRPEERITESSRNKRRDFFLIHEITLPATLTIGAYKLKVIMKDKTTGHQDEANIPIEIVADAQTAAGT